MVLGEVQVADYPPQGCVEKMEYKPDGKTTTQMQSIKQTYTMKRYKCKSKIFIMAAEGKAIIFYHCNLFFISSA